METCQGPGAQRRTPQPGRSGSVPVNRVQLNRRTMKVDVILRRSYQDCDPVLSLGPVLSWRPLPAGLNDESAYPVGGRGDVPRRVR